MTKSISTKQPYNWRPEILSDSTTMDSFAYRETNESELTGLIKDGMLQTLTTLLPRLHDKQLTYVKDMLLDNLTITEIAQKRNVSKQAVLQSLYGKSSIVDGNSVRTVGSIKQLNIWLNQDNEYCKYLKWLEVENNEGEY